MKKLLKTLILTLGSFCFFGCSSFAEEFRIIEDWKWTDSKQDWLRRVPSCPRGMDNLGLGEYSLDNKITIKIINSCKYPVGGVNLIFDYVFFKDQKESKSNLADYIQFKILNEGEYQQLVNVLKKKYRTCEGDGNAEFVFCSKYTKFSFYGYKWTYGYSSITPSGKVGHLAITQTNYSDQKISEIIRRRKEAQKKKELGPLPKIDSKSF